MPQIPRSPTSSPMPKVSQTDLLMAAATMQELGKFNIPNFKDLSEEEQEDWGRSGAGTAHDRPEQYIRELPSDEEGILFGEPDKEGRNVVLTRRKRLTS